VKSLAGIYFFQVEKMSGEFTEESIMSSVKIANWRANFVDSSNQSPAKVSSFMVHQNISV